MSISLALWKLADSSGIIDQNFNVNGANCGSTCPNKDSLLTVTVPHVVNLMLYLVGALAIVMIVVGGLRYVISAGNPGAINGAKDTILYAVVGLVLAAAAYAIVGFTTGSFGI